MKAAGSFSAEDRLEIPDASALKTYTEEIRQN